MTSRVRRYAATAVLLVAAPLGLPTGTAQGAVGSACSIAEPSFCVTYEAKVLRSGTTTETTQSLDPADLDLSFTNTSPSYRDEPDQPRWLNGLSATLLSGSDTVPVVTSSSNLPDGLLVGGDPDGSQCGPGVGSTFSGCTAGHGVAIALIDFPASPFLPSDGVYTATYGVKQIKNVRSTSRFAEFDATLGVCLQHNGNPCYLGEQTQSQTFAIDPPAAGEPMTFDVVMPGEIPVATPIGTVTIKKFTVHTLDLVLKGRSNELADGTVLAYRRDVVRLPRTCGPASAGATLTSRAGAAVTVEQALSITGCTTLTATAAVSNLLYGAGTSLSGTLVETGSGIPVEGRVLSLRSCPVGGTCSSRTATTNASGSYTFAVKPSRNTTYTVSEAISHRTAAKAIKVRPTVTRSVSRTSMPSGGTVRINGSVAPSHAGKAVRIQRRVAGVWRTIASATLSTRSAYATSLTLRGARGTTASLRVVLPAHADHATGTSPVAGIRFS